MIQSIFNFIYDYFSLLPQLEFMQNLSYLFLIIYICFTIREVSKF